MYVCIYIHVCLCMYVSLLGVDIGESGANTRTLDMYRYLGCVCFHVSVRETQTFDVNVEMPLRIYITNQLKSISCYSSTLYYKLRSNDDQDSVYDNATVSLDLLVGTHPCYSNFEREVLEI